MNLVGKIFTAIIFVMCLVFASFALMVHAAHKNWRTVAYDYSTKLDAANKKYDDLQQEKKRVEQSAISEKQKLEESLTKAENAAKNNDEKYQQAAKTNVQLDHDLREAAAVVKSVNQNLTARMVEIDSLRKANEVAVTDRQAVFDRLIHTTDDATTAKAEVQRLQGAIRDVTEAETKLKVLAGYVGAREADMAKNPPYGLTGEVTAVPRPDVVEISVGYDDGVRKGHKFAVTRPSTGKYIGDVEVVQVNYPNRAVCRPDKTMMRDQIQKGDHVQASLDKRK